MTQYKLLMRRKDLADALQVSIGTVDNMRREGRLPEPVEISPRCIGWPRKVIESWLEEQWSQHSSENVAF